jgi:hypothetical protein
LHGLINIVQDLVGLERVLYNGYGSAPGGFLSGTFTATNCQIKGIIIHPPFQTIISKEKIMKNLRFLSVTAILVIVLVAVLGIGVVSAQSVCSPATAISVPFTKDGPGTFCYQASSMCSNINSWNMTSLQINGNNYTNMWVSGASIPALNGAFTITYNGGQFGHFEIDGPCSGGPTATRTNTPFVPTNTNTEFARTATVVTTLTRTFTPGGPTVTRTSTPSFTPTLTRTPTQGQGVSLKVQYMPGDANASTTAIHPKIRVVNTGSVSVPFDDINLSYWYTGEVTTQTQTWACISATIPGGCTNIVGDAYPLSPARPAADFVLQNIFVIGIGDLAPGQSFDIEYTITKSDGSLYTQTGDYSFNPSFTTYTDWPKITLYYDGTRTVIWGVEPIAPTMTPTMTPTATMTGGICAPVEADITAPFDFTGAGTHCWRISAMNSLNNNNLRLLSINGMNLTGVFVTAAQLPPQINGFWYITFASDVPWGHLQIFQ